MTADPCDVVIVEDEFFIAEYLRDVCEGHGYRVGGIAATAEDAVALARSLRPRLVLMDVTLSGAKDGVDAAMEIHGTLGTPVVFITGSDEPRNLDRIHTDHPAALLIKPVAPATLVKVLREQLG